jgi:hypothetical protein
VVYPLRLLCLSVQSEPVPAAAAQFDFALAVAGRLALTGEGTHEMRNEIFASEHAVLALV